MTEPELPKVPETPWPGWTGLRESTSVPDRHDLTEARADR